MTVLTGFIFVPVVLALREALTELGVIGAVMSSSGGEDDDSLKMVNAARCDDARSPAPAY